MKLQKQSGYSESVYREIFGNNLPIFLSGSNGFESRNEFVDGQRTNKIDKIIGEFYFPKLGVVTVKFEPNTKLPDLNDLQKVQIVGAQAIVIKNDVYVKAEGIRVIE